MLKRLKDANDLLEEAINGVDTNHPNWGIPIAIIMKEVKPIA
jgi:murein L,D-transpeptidase YcbB/YkuD